MKKALKKRRKRRMAAPQMTATRCWTWRGKPERLTETGTFPPLISSTLCAGQQRYRTSPQQLPRCPPRPPTWLQIDTRDSARGYARWIQCLSWLSMC